jgi:hypothetical protein
LETAIVKAKCDVTLQLKFQKSSLYFLVCMRIHQFVQSMGIVAVLISLFWKEWKFGE